MGRQGQWSSRSGELPVENVWEPPLALGNAKLSHFLVRCLFNLVLPSVGEQLSGSSYLDVPSEMPSHRKMPLL